MTPRLLTLAGLIFVPLTLGCAVWGLPVQAAIVTSEPPSCYTLDQAVADTVDHGGRIIGIVDDVPAVGADQFLIFSFSGHIMLAAVDDGCMAYSPVALLPALDETPA